MVPWCAVKFRWRSLFQRAFSDICIERVCRTQWDWTSLTQNEITRVMSHWFIRHGYGPSLQPVHSRASSISLRLGFFLQKHFIYLPSVFTFVLIHASPHCSFHLTTTSCVKNCFLGCEICVLLCYKLWNVDTSLSKIYTKSARATGSLGCISREKALCDVWIREPSSDRFKPSVKFPYAR